MCGKGRITLGVNCFGNILNIIANAVQAINDAIPVSGMQYGAQSFQTAATQPDLPSESMLIKAFPTCSAVMNPPTFCFISVISSSEKLFKIGVDAIDGHKHIILMDLSAIAAAMQRVAETTALLDEL